MLGHIEDTFFTLVTQVLIAGSAVTRFMGAAACAKLAARTLP
jgi:hypothetical protein